MKFKGTKGDWEASSQKGTPGHCFMAQVFVDGKNMASIEPTINQEEASANARLMAAAPALLQSLQKVLNKSRYLNDLGREFCENPEFKKAERAIKKALEENKAQPESELINTK